VKDIKARLSQLHEEDIAGWFSDGQRHPGSGNQFTKPLDGRTGFAGEWDFAWDCKAAMPGTKSISVTRGMLDKLLEQCHGRRPLLPLRFYDTEQGDYRQHHDLIVIRASDAIALLEYADGNR
jgi:hypothetical protein